MTDLEKKLEQSTTLHREVQAAQQSVLMKSGQLNDLMQDIAVNHFGFSKETKEYSLPDLLKKAYLEGKK